MSSRERFILIMSLVMMVAVFYNAAWVMTTFSVVILIFLDSTIRRNKFLRSLILVIFSSGFCCVVSFIQFQYWENSVENMEFYLPLADRREGRVIFLGENKEIIPWYVRAALVLYSNTGKEHGAIGYVIRFPMMRYQLYFSKNKLLKVD